MIPLSLPVSADGDTSFVARLATPFEAGDNPAPGVATLVGEIGQRSMFRIDSVHFELPVPSVQVVGDVVFVDPARGRAMRWLRRGSPHNTLVVTEQCDQLCVMCSQPPKKGHFDQFDHFRAACLLAEPGSLIGVSGGEPTLHKARLLDFLEAVLEARPDLHFHVLTNGQHFEPDDVERLRRTAYQRVCWGIPLYAAEPRLHDAIVAKPGAFERLERSLAVLLRAGATIELRTVVMTSNAPVLGELARFVTARLPFISIWAIMQLERIGYARNRWRELYFDHVDDFAPVASAIDQAVLRGTPVELYNFPRCTVPSAYRGYAAVSISDWKRKYLPACEGCAERTLCTGFFEWHLDDEAAKGVRPL